MGNGAAGKELHGVWRIHYSPPAPPRESKGKSELWSQLPGGLAPTRGTAQYIIDGCLTNLAVVTSWSSSATQSHTPATFTKGSLKADDLVEIATGCWCSRLCELCFTGRHVHDLFSPLLVLAYLYCCLLHRSSNITMYLSRSVVCDSLPCKHNLEANSYWAEAAFKSGKLQSVRR